MPPPVEPTPNPGNGNFNIPPAADRNTPPSINEGEGCIPGGDGDNEGAKYGEAGDKDDMEEADEGAKHREADDEDEDDMEEADEDEDGMEDDGEGGAMEIDSASAVILPSIARTHTGRVGRAYFMCRVFRPISQSSADHGDRVWQRR